MTLRKEIEEMWGSIEDEEVRGEVRKIMNDQDLAEQMKRLDPGPLGNCVLRSMATLLAAVEEMERRGI